MKKITLAFFTGLLFAFPAFLFSQTTNTNCPGVPGACGYPAANHSATRNGPNYTPQDGSNTLGNSYSATQCGLNFLSVSNRIGQRFTPVGVQQPAPFVVSGLAPCDSIIKAFLWVEGSGTGAAQTATIQPPSGPTQNFPLSIIGQGPDKCWGYAGSVTYRADVTSVINGNGTYNISGLLTNPPTSGEDMDGATLMVIYKDLSATYQGTILIDDGAIEVSGGTANYTMNFAPVCGATTNAQAFCCVGDIQMPVNSLTMNGTPATFTWDWWNYVQVPTTVNASQSSSNFNLFSSGDCFNLCVVGLYYQTTTCATCSAASSSSFTLATASTQSTCAGCDGTATVTPSPSGTYTYTWSPSGQTTQTATNLCAGTYTVSVSSACYTNTISVTVANAGSLTATSTQINPTCFGGADGSATVTPSGGTGPYTYSWTPSGGNAATATNLSAGTYTCTITDSSGCTTLQSVSITQPSGMNITMNISNVTCNGQSNGSATANVTGGSPTYTYSWSPTGGTGPSETNLSAGSYTLTVTDSNGCAQLDTVTITQPAPLFDSMSVVPVGCFATGSATATTSGGTGPYTYLWQDGNTSSTDNNLSVGTYTVLITDANGCTLVDTAVVTSTNGISTTQSYSNITCFGAGDGTATVNPSGGQPPYTYSWSPFGGNNATATNLPTGTYTCTVTDANGCVTQVTFAIVEPPQLTSSPSSTNVSCNGGADGSATISPSGGSPPFTYLWSPTGSTNQTENGLQAGTYTVTATDSSGCSTTQIITITQPSAVVASTGTNAVCAGSPSPISATAGGGVSPYTYAWSNGATTQTQTVTLTSSTTFTVIVTDANGCTDSTTTTAIVNPIPTAAITSNAVNGIFSLSGANGQLCFTGSTTGVTSWSWDLNGTDTSSQQSPCVAVTAANVGTYCATLIVTNSFGCIDTAETCIDISNVFYSIPNVFTPNGDGSNDGFVITNTGMKTLRCKIYNRWGELIYEWDGTAGYWDGKTLNGKEAVDGVYYYTAYLVDYGDKVYDESGFVHLIRGGGK